MSLSKRERGIAARAEQILHDRYLLAQTSGVGLDPTTDGNLDLIKQDLRDQRATRRRDARAAAKKKKKTNRSQRQTAPGSGRTNTFTFDFNHLSQAVPSSCTRNEDAMEQDADGQTDGYGGPLGDLVSTQPNVRAGKKSLSLEDERRC
ncbi:hypothetical protein KVT40_003405 [Elsinoe batatas]|uniref:Uncharacterized protein n=1 Tax=Elsinoe batatas TaxID=2601811 RepID=A0A8K0L621_9PEZI|nr:hypothetical protein KVT40_003405 [Elsinoe batatas]